MPNGSDSVSYDLFLSYNSADHKIVEEIAHKLADAGLNELFLDRQNLLIGTRFRPALEKALGFSKAVAIFIGPGEMGSWQQMEVDIALDRHSKNPNFPVIPVLLPGCEPPLGFLGEFTWVDFRSQALDIGIAILAKAARRDEPGPALQRHLDSVRASICPYRGLFYFREEDAPFFFGREVAIAKLMDEVQRQPFVAVVGASGSGKSSVVRAGLMPKLRKDRHTAWETVILVPTDQPLKALARAFSPLLEPTMDEIDRLTKAAKLAEHFRSGTISLYDIVERVLEKQSGTDRVLIVVDQFEELYTLTSDEEARRRFLDELLVGSSRAGCKANIILTLRGDFVGRALAYRPLSDRLQDAQINLGPMTREELEWAIRKPAEKIQLEFEAGLVRRILSDVGDEPGNLPLLEFVLKELWDKRRGRILLNETYDAIGGLQGAVATKADELFKGLSSAEQNILQRIFLRIVRPSAESGLDTRRRAAFTELPPEGKELVVKLTDERLLVTNQSASGLEQTVEVAHEALISNWGTLRTWVNEDREFLLWRDRIGPLVAEWERAQENDEALLRGPLLVEAQKWFDQRSQDLSDQERKFISASREDREQLTREEKERQERELEAVQRLARTEAERAKQAERAQRLEEERAQEAEKRAKEQKEVASRLRRLAWVLAAVALVAVGGAIFGFWQKNEAESQKPASRADLDRWKESILALQAPNGGFRFVGPTSEPQVWTTARCLTALLASPLDLKEDHDKIVKGFEYIEHTRDEKADGWGLFEDGSVAQTEITAWVCVANAQLLASTRSTLFADQVPNARRRISRDLASIARCQLPSPKGAWSPIWVPEKMVPELARTYSTVMALWALAEARDVSDIREEIGSKYDAAINDGVAWLLATFRRGVGLPVAPFIGTHDSYPGLTAQAVYVLRRIERVRPNLGKLGTDLIAKDIFLNLVNTGEPFQNRDVMDGEVSDLRPTLYKLENSSFLRFPWFLLAASSLKNDDALLGASKEKAEECFARLEFRSHGLDRQLRTAQTWEIAETLYCVSRALEQDRESEW
jgi:hypothetical protein